MKQHMLSLKHQILEHPYMLGFFALLSALLKFVVESLAVDGILFLFLFVMIMIDTYTGMKSAKLQGIYDYRLITKKAGKKVLGQLIILGAFWFFTMMLFVFNWLAPNHGINPYLLNIPMMTTLLFYGGTEVLSIKDNVQKVFSVVAPISVMEKVKAFVDAGGKESEKLIDK